MGFLDKFKGKNADAPSDQATQQATEHDVPIDTAIDQVAELADKATGGKHTGKIDEAAAKLKEAADRLEENPKA